MRYLVRMDNNPFLAAGGAGLLVLIVYVFFSIVVFVVVLRILYAVIWRAVRKGIREYHHENPTVPPVA